MSSSNSLSLKAKNQVTADSESNHTCSSHDTGVDIDLDSEEHLEYYLNPDFSQGNGANALPHPIPMLHEKPNNTDGLLPPRSSSLPKMLETRSNIDHFANPLDVSIISDDSSEYFDTPKRQKYPPTLKRLGSEQNLHDEGMHEAPKSAALKPPTPKFPPPEAIRPFDKKHDQDDPFEAEDRVANGEQASGSTVYLANSSSATKAENTQKLKGPSIGLTLFDIVLEEPKDDTPRLEQPPQKLELQPFWLMRCFERSMIGGGFISSKMYIPRSLWYQGGARLSAIEAKISACELLTATLYNMALSLGQSIPPSTTSTANLRESDIVVLLRELESFDTVLYSVQNNLAKKLSFIESIKKSQSSFLSLGNRITKSLERMTTSRDKIDDVSLYIDVLIKLFQTCQILDHWIKQFHAMPSGEPRAQVLSRLVRISEFMNNVICAFVMRDLTVLMAKYMKRCKEWLTD
ncbi:hypothetical protein K493DRAFT_412385 [Basidiobolus meristosporus CBS 931.73]|uniref:Uncharacterized protein n=1 Tax=Basidiobolus meristosporus CBS 931.73 TaxID=1314790 RepID=A0A1Y1WX95_9FUNG|nr:hypothetical protein K493DRAFT_412385 [Basidiobolus meristosporus CBS 931.73]|eukprot:ORX78177.1 hypothetical protein K493DRAFT_412385 [Basidiobolus meristosporus CBS 931.73]